jgi:uncharacterized protein YifE (UPF0438 family)
MSSVFCLVDGHVLQAMIDLLGTNINKSREPSLKRENNKVSSYIKVSIMHGNNTIINAVHGIWRETAARDRQQKCFHYLSGGVAESVRVLLPVVSSAAFLTSKVRKSRLTL